MGNRLLRATAAGQIRASVASVAYRARTCSHNETLGTVLFTGHHEQLIVMSLLSRRTEPGRRRPAVGCYNALG